MALSTELTEATKQIDADALSKGIKDCIKLWERDADAFLAKAKSKGDDEGWDGGFAAALQNCVDDLNDVLSGKRPGSGRGV